MSRRKPTPLFRDEVQQGAVRLRGLLGMLESAAAARDCPATREAVEKIGESGCPLCGGIAGLHRDEVPA